MPYSTRRTSERAVQMRRTIGYGKNIIGGVVVAAYIQTQASGIFAHPYNLNHILYLVLLVATGLLTYGWIFVTNRELDILCQFLDPVEYLMPSETAMGISTALALTILLYTAREPLWFGASYSAYMLLSVIFWKHGLAEIDKAIRGSRKHLNDESDRRRNVYGGALDLLHSYYVRQPNMRRLYVSLVLGLAGLALSILALKYVPARLQTIAYVAYIVSVLGFEVGLASYWRFKLYRTAVPFEMAISDFEDQERNRHE